MVDYLRAIVTRFLGEQTLPGASASAFGLTHVAPGYPTMTSMSALAAFPFVRAAVTAIADDLSGLPLICTRHAPDGTVSEIPDHWTLRLLRRPNRGQTERQLRRQLLTDEALTGNAYAYAPLGIGVPGELYRLHPGLMQIDTDGMGLPVGYRYNAANRYTVDQVIHVADVSWSDDVRMIFGESAIRTLHDQLTASKAAMAMVAKAATRGRPDWLLTPPADAAVGQAQIEAVRKAWETQLRDGLGAVATSVPMLAHQLTLSPRDMEFQELHEQTISAILAVFGVPGTRVGKAGANHAVAKTDMRMYWEALRARASRFDDALSRLTGDPRIRISHDFSAVEALQVAYGERQDRVKSWVEMGANPREAAEYELFLNPPLAPDAEPRSSQMRPASAQEPEEPQGTRGVGGTLAECIAAHERAVKRGWTDLRPSDLERWEPLLGIDRAAALAEVIHEAVALHVAESRDAGTEPWIRGLYCFAPAFVAAHMEAA